MKVAILGGGGCFALNFARHLNENGIEHFGIGRSRRKADPFWLAPPAYNYHALHLVTQLQAVMAVLDTEKPDVVVNFAAQGEGAASFGENAPDFFQTNTVALSKLVLELEKRVYLRRFVQIGSSEVYGSPSVPAMETDLLDPTSPYSVSKAAFDLYLCSMWRNRKFQMNIVRPSNCYTEGQQLYRVIPRSIVHALKGEKLPLHGGGRAQKSYLHATDLSMALLTVIQEAPLGAIYNVGPDKPISIRALVAHVAAALGRSLDDIAVDVDDRVGQDAKYHLCMDAIKTFGWKQEIDLESGIAGMVAWVRKYPLLLSMDTTYRHRA